MKFEIIKVYLRLLKYRNGKAYYSETGEDAVIEQIFANEIGKYVDVGASHPIIGNNTYKFYKRGWKGIGIEPIKTYEKLWKIARPKDKFFQGVVSDSMDDVEFVEFSNSLLSSTDKALIEEHKRRGIASIQYSVKAISLKNLLPEKLSPNEPYLVSIDVEGAELTVLKTINFNQQRPRVILIESWSLPWEKKNKAISYLENHASYQLFAYTGLTAVMVPSEIMKRVRGLRAKLENLD